MVKTRDYSLGLSLWRVQYGVGDFFFPPSFFYFGPIGIFFEIFRVINICEIDACWRSTFEFEVWSCRRERREGEGEGSLFDKFRDHPLGGSQARSHVGG